ncbi:HsdR family type I site-specific deoxyribonuclease [Oscillospiraceae bacterium PP1C4]
MDCSFAKGQFTEAELENAIISLFEEQGYTHVLGDSLHRRLEDILLEEDMIAYLNKKYSVYELTEKEIRTIINNLKLISSEPLYLGNREAFWLVNEGFDLVREDINKASLHIDYIDFDDIKNGTNYNIYKVINQYAVVDNHLRIPDMLIFINGIPVTIFEFKSAIKEDTTIADAWKQIHIRYNRDIPKLLRYCFLSVISDGANTRLASIFTPYEYYYSWNKVNDKEKAGDGISSLFTMIKGAFTKERILAILRDFVYYPDESGKELAIITRYPQFFAAEKMFDNIEKHLKPFGDGKGGTYFGATGCGKTYTMLFLARMLSQHKREVFNNPTIIILTDREDLDTQTAELFEVSKHYLCDKNVRSIDSREDLSKTLHNIESGGVYITTIQKFCEGTGLLSNRNNIICISDEAHRTQTNTSSKLKVSEEKGVEVTYGFAYFLHEAFPNGTYCGFTGTPVDETLAVFGDIVDSYTMKESSDDGITVRISYEPRLARVIVSDEQAKEIQQYYNKCLDDGASSDHVEDSKRAMSKLEKVLSNPQRLNKLANDIVTHYDTLCAEKPNIVQKAMIVCASRTLAFELYKKIKDFRPDWFISQKAENEDKLAKEDLDKLIPLEKIKLVATRDKDDEKELFELCGTKEYRAKLDKQFKDNNSNFKIAIVVDMWITGFDVPSLAVMYIDKPLQKHTLIQTISRVNRVFEGKDKGLVVDYIGIKDDMMVAIKKYGETKDSPVDEFAVSMSIFKNHLSLIDALLHGFNADKFFSGEPLERLTCLNLAAEYVQTSKDMETRFMDLSRKLKAAYEICVPSGELTELEVTKAQFYLAIRSILYKQVKGDAPDTETMNRVVEKMVQDAISCTGVENIIDVHKSEDMFSEEFLKQLDSVKLPITKFNALLKILRKAISQYSKVNRLKAIDFDERLKKVVEQYNNRDKMVFTSEVVEDFVNDLSSELIKIMEDLKEDKSSFEKMGITYEEKAFFDILVKVRDTHKFKYDDEKCVVLAKKIKELVDDKAQYADWSTRDDIKNQLNRDLTVLLYQNGYPPEWDEEIFEKVMEQAENFKKYS